MLSQRKSSQPSKMITNMTALQILTLILIFKAEY